MRELYEIPHTHLVVTDTVSHLIQNSKTCWVLLTVDSVIAEMGMYKYINTVLDLITVVYLKQNKLKSVKMILFLLLAYSPQLRCIDEKR